jgi:hypothetical protein
MKRKIIVLLSLLFVLVFLGYNEVFAKKFMFFKVGKEGAKVSLVEGTAQVLPPGEKAQQVLKVGYLLEGGEEVSTAPRSRLELTLPDNSKIRFADNTRFKVLQMDVDSDAKNVKFHVSIGRVWAKVRKLVGKKDKFELTCNNAVCGVRGTVYRINVNDDDSAMVKVYDGLVHVAGVVKKRIEAPQVVGAPTEIAGPKTIRGPQEVTMQEWGVIVKSMQQIAIRSDGTAEVPRDFTEQEDKYPWVDWNKTKDQQL